MCLLLAADVNLCGKGRMPMIRLSDEVVVNAKPGRIFALYEDVASWNLWGP